MGAGNLGEKMMMVMTVVVGVLGKKRSRERIAFAFGSALEE